MPDVGKGRGERGGGAARARRDGLKASATDTRGSGVERSRYLAHTVSGHSGDVVVVNELIQFKEGAPQVQN